jgi:hypothetical protein
MKKQLIDLACRRHLLLEKINTQRREIAEISLQLQKPLALVDTGIKTIHFIRSHLTLATGSLALLLALRRGNLRLMAQEGWRLFSQYSAKK